MDILTSEFNTEKFYLGSLCKRRHDWNGTGQSLRHKAGHCCECARIQTQTSNYRQKLGIKSDRKTRYEFFQEILLHTVFTDECFIWSAFCSTAAGYGLVKVNGKEKYVHRLALEHKLGRLINKGMCACHTCDNPACFNPNHLFEGTQVDNIQDMHVKNRHNSARGEHHNRSKLTSSQVLEIRSRHAAGGITMEKLSQEFGVGADVISRIINRRAWKHI